jgi:hypothetical protein
MKFHKQIQGRILRVLTLAAVLGLAACENLSLEDVLDTSGDSGALSASTIAAGLKEALEVGTGRAVGSLGVAGGFLDSSRFRIPLPETLVQARNIAGRVGLDGYFDELEVKLNEAAEAAVPKAQRLFLGAIREMTLDDVMQIYEGGDTAATDYFRRKTSADLVAEMRPVVDSSLNEVGAVRLFGDLASRYNRIPLVDDVDADISSHVLDYASDALFTRIAEEEAAIRRDPLQRTTALLRTVFGR